MTQQTERATFEEGAWYWVEKEGWIGDPPTIAPARYSAGGDSWNSFSFSGIPTRNVKVLEPCRRATPEAKQAMYIADSEQCPSCRNLDLYACTCPFPTSRNGGIAKQAVQWPEPDAYLFQHEETGQTMFVEAQQVEWGFESNNPRLKKIHGVYTEQQVRAMLQAAQASPVLQPLTDEQISRLNLGAWKGGGDITVKFARAIERAHGIGAPNAD